MLFDFVRCCDIQLQAWTLAKRQFAGSDELIAAMSRALGAFTREHYAYFLHWDRVVIYCDNGQKEITNLVNSVFNAHLTNVEVRRVAPTDYSLFQAADLYCTLELLQAKLRSGGLSKSESDFFSPTHASAARTLTRVYIKPLVGKRFP